LFLVEKEEPVNNTETTAAVETTPTPAPELTPAQNVVELTPETPAVTTTEEVVKTPAKRGRKPGSKNAPKVVAKTAKKTAAKTATKRTAGVKAQTQVDKHLSKWFDSQAKEKSTKDEKVRRADVIRQAMLKGAKAMGYKLPEA
jgi:hypothetical protein